MVLRSDFPNLIASTIIFRWVHLIATRQIDVRRRRMSINLKNRVRRCRLLLLWQTHSVSPLLALVRLEIEGERLSAAGRAAATLACGSHFPRIQSVIHKEHLFTKVFHRGEKTNMRTEAQTQICSLLSIPRVIVRPFGLFAYVFTHTSGSHQKPSRGPRHIDGEAEIPTFTKTHKSTTVRKVKLHLLHLNA